MIKINHGFCAFDEICDVRNENIKDSKKLIEDTHIEGHITPLHIATAKFCALST